MGVMNGGRIPGPPRESSGGRSLRAIDNPAPVATASPATAAPRNSLRRDGPWPSGDEGLGSRRPGLTGAAYRVPIHRTHRLAGPADVGGTDGLDSGVTDGDAEAGGAPEAGVA